MSVEDVKKKMQLERVAAAMPVEIGATAGAAQTRALVEARFVMALNRPRNMDQVRSDLLKECSRPSFALEDEEGKGNSALYRKPVGGGTFAEGLGIRFAEVALRCMGNTMADAYTIQDDDKERVKYCYVIDLEKNQSWGDTVHITKTVERSSLKEGEIPLKSRTNSRGKPTYLVEASEDALTTKQAALVSKMMRTLALRLIPGDLQDQCIAEIKKVRTNKITEDPDAAKHRVIDGMAKQNVSVIMLEAFLGHPIDQITPAQIVTLQSLYGSLRDGEATWADIMRTVEEQRQAKTETSSGGSAKGVAAVKEKIEAAAKKVEQPAVPVAPVTPITPVVPAQPTNAPISPVSPAQPTPATSGGAPPWLNPTPTSQPAPVTAAAPLPASLEAQVAAMALEQTPEPATPVNRIKPKEPAVKKIQLPEFADIVTQSGPDGPWTPELYGRAKAAIEAIPGNGGEEQLLATIERYIGLPIQNVNYATLEVMTGILENFTKK